MNKKLWEIRHQNSRGRFNRVTEFAKFSYEHFLKSKKGTLLDLGCGKGADSIFFYENGFEVSCIDFSQEAIKQFNEIQNRKGVFITALVRDISERFPFEKESFDVVYSRLGLHNLKDEDLKNVFSEIKRVLKNNGILLLQTKSVNDKKYGRGNEIEDNIFKDELGFTRHFFSKEEIKDYLKDFLLIFLDEKKIDNGNAYLEICAQKE
ncbi:methyltransferase domain-containing protein [Candidatus Woesearchaeota archaeon]|nr:methyltransferase domain-containing protein [Candidatus Woesearchaeota archaeon]